MYHSTLESRVRKKEKASATLAGAGWRRGVLRRPLRKTERERERERERDREREKERVSERERECVCVCVREREREKERETSECVGV